MSYPVTARCRIHLFTVSLKEVHLISLYSGEGGLYNIPFPMPRERFQQLVAMRSSSGHRCSGRYNEQSIELLEGRYVSFVELAWFGVEMSGARSQILFRDHLNKSK